jgi:alpha-beta hydrolase superfamily lysophospholipase
MQFKRYKKSNILLATALAFLSSQLTMPFALAATPETTGDSQIEASSVKAELFTLGNLTTPAKAAILAIHGLGLNSQAYNDFATRMANRGIVVYAIDVRGFGTWMKYKDGRKFDFGATLLDIEQALKTIRSKNPCLPVVLLGESMGGAIVIKAASQYPQLMDGLISSAPSGQRYKSDGTDLKVGEELITGARKQFDVGTRIVDQATQNEQLRKLWESSPLNRMDLSAIELIQFQKFMDGNHAAAVQIKDIPVLFLQGTHDHLVKAQGSWEIFNDIKSENRTFVALPSEHLVIEYGIVRSDVYDVGIAQMIENWIMTNTLKNAEGSK